MRAEVGGGGETVEGVMSASRPFDIRAYRVTNPSPVNKSIAELEAMPRSDRVSIVNVRSGDMMLKPAPDVVIREGDVIAVIGRQEIHATRGDTIGPEVSDPELLDIPIESLDVVITNRAIAGRSLTDLARLQSARGVVLSKFTRSGIEIPISSLSLVDRGDVLRLIGPLPEVEKAAAEPGYPDRRTSARDMIFVGTGIFLGELVGLLSVVVWSAPLTLTASGSALVMGLVSDGSGRSIRSSAAFRSLPFGSSIPSDFACSLRRRPDGLAELCRGLHTTGFSLVVAGLLTAFLPHTLGIPFGRYVLKMDPLIVLGACAGAGTITAALRAVQDEAQSSIPALGYTVPRDRKSSAHRLGTGHRGDDVHMRQYPESGVHVCQVRWV